jgi:flagellar hook-basal body complex protein FliE
MTTAIAPIAWMPESTIATSAIGEPSMADFGSILKAGSAGLTEQTDRASELLMAYAAGENVATHELVMAMEQAKLSLQLAVEVRNRLVDAYQELTRLQI